MLLARNLKQIEEPRQRQEDSNRRTAAGRYHNDNKNVNTRQEQFHQIILVSSLDGEI